MQDACERSCMSLSQMIEWRAQTPVILYHCRLAWHAALKKMRFKVRFRTDSQRNVCRGDPVGQKSSVPFIKIMLSAPFAYRLWTFCAPFNRAENCKIAGVPVIKDTVYCTPVYLGVPFSAKYSGK